MSTFVCSVVDAKGNRTSFRRDAAHEAAILRDLNQEGYFIISVQPALAAGGAQIRKLKASLVLEFTQILATLMANGLRVKEAISIARRVGAKAVAPLLQHVEQRVEKGDSLFDSLSAWKSSFSPLYLGLIRIGEKTGDLAMIFQRLGDYLRGRQALRSKMVNSLYYPAFILGIAVLGIILLATLLLPGLTGIIGSINPHVAAVYKQNVMHFQAGAGVFVAVIVLAAAMITFSLSFRSRNADWALRFDAFLLKLPVVRTFLQVSFGLNFSFAMETLLTSGYSLENALEESAWVVSNAAYRSGMARVKDRVVKGTLLSEALRQEKLFPQVLTGWMAVGEGAHDLVKSFAQVRAYFQQESDKLTSIITSLAEPAIIVMVGVIMITLILTFITPIFTMLGNLF